MASRFDQFVTEAKAITADIPEERITHDVKWTPKKFDLSRWKSFLRPSDCWRSVKKKSRPSERQCAISHKLIFDEVASGTLDTPQARIKVDETSCFGVIQWSAVRNAASSFHPKHAAVAIWKHRALSFVEGVQEMPKDRGAEQGDVDGPLEGSFALGMVAVEARLCVSEQQAARTTRPTRRRKTSRRTAQQDATYPKLSAGMRGKAHWSGRSATCSTRKRRSGRPVVSG